MSTAPTIQAVIDMALAATPYDRTYDTVDTVKTGDPQQPVLGIATTLNVVTGGPFSLLATELFGD